MSLAIAREVRPPRKDGDQAQLLGGVVLCVKLSNHLLPSTCGAIVSTSRPTVLRNSTPKPQRAADGREREYRRTLPRKSPPARRMGHISGLPGPKQTLSSGNG